MVKKAAKFLIKRFVYGKKFPLYKFPVQEGINVSSDFNTGRYLHVQVDKDIRINIGGNVHMREFCNILVKAPAELTIGKDTFFNNYCSINCIHKITIGEGCLFGEGVKIYDHNHAYSSHEGQLTIQKAEFTTAPIHIGNNCWIGSNVTILKGVTIGDNVIIGANNLIFKSVPSNSIVKSKTELIIESKQS